MNWGLAMVFCWYFRGKLIFANTVNAGELYSAKARHAEGISKEGEERGVKDGGWECSSR
jgi:hypothetical protein